MELVVQREPLEEGDGDTGRDLPLESKADRPGPARDDLQGVITSRQGRGFAALTLQVLDEGLGGGHTSTSSIPKAGYTGRVLVGRVSRVVPPVVRTCGR